VGPAAPNRRKYPRVPIRTAVRVEAFDPDGARWEELTVSEDASRGGVSFNLRHRVTAGQVLFLHLALPAHLRVYDEYLPAYGIYGLVRSVGASQGGALVRARFLGRKAPKDYASNPAMRYLMPQDAAPKKAGIDRRKHPRSEVFVELRVRWAEGAEAKEERTFTENVSRWGARVPTSLPLTRGDTVTVSEVNGAFESRAEVANVYIGKDNIPRLNLRLIDQSFPDRFLATGS
jgi:hypothetical protein